VKSLDCIAAKRLVMTLSGVFACSFSVGLFNLSAFGVDPFQCFAQGTHGLVSSRVGYGPYYLGLSLLMLAGIWLWDRRFVGLATFINMFLTGYIVDWSFRFLSWLLPSPSLYQRIPMLLAAVVVMCFGSALYYTANLGVSVYDAVSLILAKRGIRVGGRTVPFKWIRVFNDLVCVTLGTLTGKLPGAGTLVTAFFMGPLITFFNRTFAEPFLQGRADSPTGEMPPAP